MRLRYCSTGECDACGWREEDAPKLYLLIDAEIEVAGREIRDPKLCSPCLKKHGINLRRVHDPEPDPR